MRSKGLDPALMTTFLASVIAKGSRQGIHDAKDFVRQTESEGYISKEVGDSVSTFWTATPSTSRR